MIKSRANSFIFTRTHYTEIREHACFQSLHKESLTFPKPSTQRSKKPATPSTLRRRIQDPQHPPTTIADYKRPSAADLLNCTTRNHQKIFLMCRRPRHYGTRPTRTALPRPRSEPELQHRSFSLRPYDHRSWHPSSCNSKLNRGCLEDLKTTPIELGVAASVVTRELASSDGLFFGHAELGLGRGSGRDGAKHASQ